MKKWVVFSVALLFGAALASVSSPAAAELKVGVSGYVKLDVMYADKVRTDQTFGPGSTPLDTDATADNQQTIVDARESRLRVTFSDEVARIKVSGRIEGHFFGAGDALGNGHGFTLRHAYVRADHPSGFFLLAGQNWSLFMNDEIAANTSSPGDIVDFNGPAGLLSARQPQLRVGYKTPLARGMGDLLFEADIERHSLTDPSDLGGDAVANATEAGVGQAFPLFAGKVSWLHPRFQAEAAFAVAESTAIIPVTGDDVSETAWGFQVSANVNLAPFAIFGHYQIINGLGRLANGDFPDAFLVGTSLENVESTGFYFGAMYSLTKDTSVTAMYGWAEADEIAAAGFTGNQLETHQSIHVDLIHNFWERWRAGIEYRRFDVEAFNGTKGDINVVQAAVWYFF